MPIRAQVDDMNQSELQRCEGTTKLFHSQDMPGTTAQGATLSLEEATKLLNQETRFPERLGLRIGAQVMLIMVCLCFLTELHQIYADTTEHEGQYTRKQSARC